MNDMRSVIVPKSDQINADDLIAGPLTIAIQDVTIRPGTEQPVSIHFDGDGGKPYKPCKSMARVLVSQWGPDASAYVGRGLTLYRDAKVQWGGMAVGGIRISHMSHIPNDVTMALTATKGKRTPFTVKPLRTAAPPTSQPAAEESKKRTIGGWLDDVAASLSAAQDRAAVDDVMVRFDVFIMRGKLRNGALERLDAITKEAMQRTEDDAPLPDDHDDDTVDRLVDGMGAGNVMGG